jgi:hypothetical protein
MADQPTYEELEQIETFHKRIESMLSKKKMPATSLVPPCGDLVLLNRNRLILDLVGSGFHLSN